MNDKNSLEILTAEIAHCTVCAGHLPLGPRPVVRASPTARILIVGQAPGRLVHESGTPWDDPSGKRLRRWMNTDESVFYDSTQVGIVPMSFCFPGTGKSGDLPPRPECAPLWHEALLTKMPAIELTLLIGQYAQHYYLKDRRKKNLTETAQAWREYVPAYLPLPHPSPRNNLWFKRNPWFERDVVPHLQDRVHSIL
ncbi:MAG: uracil-DNA glycosylase family protein [Gemmatimonadetes bacterium]|jgi:uracil-DNA glycosylase|nr:uracil-DNA glycosylase family protein [Gemmatimonadota bacterium]MBT5330078.1 uracil-DNA glycosylase family protein [Gemmatimonadota bacterium]MBT5449606.1 uracil-DNA glycosylase family protein [Gemmatimonadota bacterium]MBT5801848.1 uracil-DNA glycosylase family protein [Gemmatimonadota bacterium]MBT6621118.1 uracil-DNA glycosylase family protein [Gemmatimonadota bacterium]|tara:strand:- start:472 stop:1059 length:588 start_codon:yes stop_codon:yes gene_type:complete